MFPNPTLSAALHQLETELGVALFKPGRRYSGLTQHGERILDFAHRMATECERLRRDLAPSHRDSSAVPCGGMSGVQGSKKRTLATLGKSRIARDRHS